MRIIVPLCLFSVLVWSLDGQQILTNFKGVAPGILLIGMLVGLLLVQLQIALSAWRWYRTARSLGQTLHLSDAVREYYMASLVNQILPGGVTGDAARVIRSRDQGGAHLAIKSVMIERLAGQLTLLLIVVAGVIAWPEMIGSGLPAGIGKILFLAITIGLVVFALVLALQYGACGRIQAFARSLAPAIAQAWVWHGAWRWQLVQSLAIVVSYIALFAVAAATLAAPLPMVALVTIVPMTLLSMLLPVSIGGWGVREAAAAVLWPLVGLSAESGVATSVFYGLLCLVGSLPGLLFLSCQPVPVRQQPHRVTRERSQQAN